MPQIGLTDREIREMKGHPGLLYGFPPHMLNLLILRRSECPK